MPKTLLEALDQTVLSKGIPADQIKSLELDGACLAKEIEVCDVVIPTLTPQI